MRSYVRKFWFDLALLAGAAVLSGILAMVFLGSIFKYREVDKIHIILDSEGVLTGLPIGKLRSSYNLVTFDLAIEFIARSKDNYQNIFQTDQFNEGVRLEVSPECDVALLTNSSQKMVPIVLPRCVFNQSYSLLVSYDTNGTLHASSNGRLLKAYSPSKLTPTFKAFAFKNGFNGERPFYGEVRTFDFKAKAFKRDRLLVGAMMLLEAICLVGIFYIFYLIFRRDFLVTEGQKTCSNAPITPPQNLR
jgi:hypothetical protein